jgi:hypothetical protein
MGQKVVLRTKYKFHLSKKLLFIAMSFLIMIGVSTSVFAEGIHPDLGKWQTYFEGEYGKGDTFFTLNFKTDGTVNIVKQYTGKNKTEDATWKMDGDNLQITSNTGGEIKDFNNKNLVKVDKNTFKWTPEGKSKTFNFTKTNTGFSIFHLFMILIVLVLINEICRRFKNIGYLIYLVLPIVLLPLWLNGDITVWFRWVKLYSVVFAAGFFTLIRFTKLGDKKWARWIVAAFLCLNILEACMQDFSCGYLPSILNATAGLINIVILSRWAQIGPDNSKERDMVWPGMTTFWIIAYDIWNITFVYLQFPEHAAFHIMVLLSCTLPAIFIKKGTWLQARAFTLGAWMMYLFTFQPWIDRQLIVLPRNDGIMLALGILSISANIIYAILHFRWKYTKKAPKKLQIGQNAKAY